MRSYPQTKPAFQLALLFLKDYFNSYMTSQIALHEQRWGQKPWFIVENDGDAIRTVSLHKIDDKTLRFGDFYLLDSCRNQGVGTGVLVDIVKDRDAKGLRVILQYLHWNSVGSLYKRHGFKVTSENEIHYFMEREAVQSMKVN